MLTVPGVQRPAVRKAENLRLDRAHDLFADGAATDGVLEPPMGHTQRPSPGADFDPPFFDEDYLILFCGPLGKGEAQRRLRTERRRRLKSIICHRTARKRSIKSGAFSMSP